MVLGGGFCGCGGGRIMVIVIVVVVMALVSPATTQTPTVQQGRFQLHASCGSKHRLRNLVVNDPMWLRTGDEDVTLFTSYINKTCLLPAHTTHLVTANLYLEIHLDGATDMEEGKQGTGEGKKVLCFFPKQDMELRKGLLKVSCLKERGEAEEEMLGAQESPSSATTKDYLATTLVTSITSLAGNTTTPASSARISAGRDLGFSSPHDVKSSTSTTEWPKDTYESLVRQPTPRLPEGTGRVTNSLGTPEKTTTTVTETKHSLVTEAETTTDSLSDGATLTTLGGSGTQEVRYTGTPTPPAGSQKPDIKKKNISAPESVMLSKAQQIDGDNSAMPNDHVVYLAGAGAGVLALVFGVAVVASVALHRRRRDKKAVRQEDLFISGAYKGSMHNLGRPGSGSESGAYLNAHVMYYSGVDPEMVESLELEERILNSNEMSYSSYDIPKCLK